MMLPPLIALAFGVYALMLSTIVITVVMIMRQKKAAYPSRYAAAERPYFLFRGLAHARIIPNR
jgi:hypothetical protein